MPRSRNRNPHACPRGRCLQRCLQLPNGVVLTEASTWYHKVPHGTPCLCAGSRPEHRQQACTVEQTGLHLPSSDSALLCPPLRPRAPSLCRPGLCRPAVKRGSSKEQGALTVRDVALLLRQPEEEAGEEEAAAEADGGGQAPPTVLLSPRAAAAAAATARATAAAAAALG